MLMGLLKPCFKFFVEMDLLFKLNFGSTIFEFKAEINSGFFDLFSQVTNVFDVRSFDFILIL